MSFSISSFAGSVITQVIKGLIGLFTSWRTERQLEVEEQKVVALEEHHQTEQDRTEVEDRIEAAGVEANEAAIKEAEETKHQMMLEHLKNTNP